MLANRREGGGEGGGGGGGIKKTELERSGSNGRVQKAMDAHVLVSLGLKLAMPSAASPTLEGGYGRDVSGDGLLGSKLNPNPNTARCTANNLSYL